MSSSPARWRKRCGIMVQTNTTARGQFSAAAAGGGSGAETQNPLWALSLTSQQPQWKFTPNVVLAPQSPCLCPLCSGSKRCPFLAAPSNLDAFPHPLHPGTWFRHLWARALLPELFLSTAWVGMMNRSVGKVHLAVHKVLKEELQEGRTAPCDFPLAGPSLSRNFLPL